MKSRAHVFISGVVQGVFFRATTRDMARQASVTGWVRNLPDQRVEAVFEGEKENVAEMIRWCRHGPHGAEVSDEDVKWEEYSGDYNSFNITF